MALQRCTIRILYITVPKFAVSQWEANSTVLTSYDIKSLTWTLDFGLNLGTVNTNRTFLVRFGGISGSFGLAKGILASEPWLGQTRLIRHKYRTRKTLWNDMPVVRQEWNQNISQGAFIQIHFLSEKLFSVASKYVVLKVLQRNTSRWRN